VSLYFSLFSEKDKILAVNNNSLGKASFFIRFNNPYFNLVANSPVLIIFLT